MTDRVIDGGAPASVRKHVRDGFGGRSIAQHQPVQAPGARTGERLEEDR